MANNNHIDESLMLKTGTILHGTYRIDGYLSSGGFGNTYVVTHINLNRKRALKEFFMKDVSERENNQSSVRVSNAGKQQEFNEQREKFKKEAQRLCDLNNKHIVRVYDLFDDNETSYYVMDFIDGENLKDRLKREGKPMSEADVLNVLKQLLDALQEVHKQGLWHMDLKPANIMMDKSGVVKLIDFGASKQFDLSKGGAISTSAVSYTKGYAPIEQIGMSYDKFGPWTDFYALGATLYNLLSNHMPPLASDIDEDTTPDKHIALPYPNGVSRQMRGLIQWMMRTNRKERPQSVNDIINYINKHMVVTAQKMDRHATVAPPRPATTAPRPLNQQQGYSSPVQPRPQYIMSPVAQSIGGKPQKQPQPETFLNNPIVSLILSIICLLPCWPIALVTIVLSIVALVKKNSGNIPQAQNLAKISTITSIVAIVLGIIIILILLLSGEFD